MSSSLISSCFRTPRPNTPGLSPMQRQTLTINWLATRRLRWQTLPTTRREDAERWFGWFIFLPLALLTQTQIQNCLIYARDIDCGGAKLTCDKNIVVPLYGQWDPRYILDIYPSAYPPNVTTWLNNQTVMIGAEKTWSEFSETVFDSFVATGSCDRNE